MGAELVDQAIAALRVAERQKTLGKKLDANRRTIVFGQFIGHQRRQPIGAEKLSHLSAGAGPGQKFVLFFSQHGARP